jgi:hypothetical protein
MSMMSHWGTEVPDLKVSRSSPESKEINAKDAKKASEDRKESTPLRLNLFAGSQRFSIATGSTASARSKPKTFE